MAVQPDATDADTETATRRLEAALDRIAAAGSRPAENDERSASIAAQLDRMIDRLRDELATGAQN